MATSKTKTTRRANNTSEKNGAIGSHTEVLTLTEAAAYLRRSEEDVLRMVRTQELAGRQIDEQWRFLKSALQDWLRTPARRTGKDALLALAGAWIGDPDIDEIVREAHRRRGRPEVENSD